MEIKTHKPRLLFLTLLITIGLFACKKEIVSTNGYERPVVEGFLVPGKSVLVKVYYQKYLDDTISYGFPITGLKLNISDGGKTIELTESSSGSYTYTDTNFVAPNKSYALSFDYNNTTVSSKTTVPSKPENFVASDSLQQVPVFSFGSTPETFVPVTLSWTNTSSGYYLMVIKNMETSRTSLNPRNSSSYRDTELTLGQVSSYQTRQMMFNYLGRHQLILFHVNKEYVDALNNNGGSSLNLTDPYTNVNNGLGIFTAMQSDTLQMRVYQ